MRDRQDQQRHVFNYNHECVPFQILYKHFQQQILMENEIIKFKTSELILQFL